MSGAPTPPGAGRDDRRSVVGIVALAVLAYVPALASSPGRMPADTKLHLYLDPVGLVGRAASTFEADQFLGWVPFQQITYLWPSGPWYVVFDVLGVPDWVAHRLWIGTILFAAGSGVLWCARRFGIPPAAAVVAGVVYQLAPLLLPYISRTSILLLPWAALGWIVGLTYLGALRTGNDATSAATPSRLARWREPALIALVVATVGSTNATTLLMVVPAPVLLLLHLGADRQVGWRDVAGLAGRVGLLCTLISLWWLAMLAVQARRGPDVLAFTETLEDVSRNATGSEVARGLGYWLFYQRNPFGPTTTASLDYLVSATAVAIGYLVVAVAIVGLVAVSWQLRRFAAWCIAAGVVLSVGVHPFGDSSPLMSLIAGDGTSGIALALRSSTRALPVTWLGVALAAAAVVAAAPAMAPATAATRMRATATALAVATVTVLAMVNLPSLWEAGLVDPAIDRDEQPPEAWGDAAAHLDDTGDRTRVIQLPGAEFGAFRWGYTADHPLVGLTEKPVVTRDLLPFGSTGAMDLLFALDDRVQTDTLDPDAVAPVARHLGADAIWVSNDLEVERFRTAWPVLVSETLAQAPEIGRPLEFGTATTFERGFPTVDPATLGDRDVLRPVPPVEIHPVDDPVEVVRARTSSVVLAGSGDGMIDAAAAGLLTGHELVRYSGDVADLPTAIGDSDHVIITDSNRDRARHWRGSQDTTGHTEPGGPGDDVLDPAPGDERLPLFPESIDHQTIAEQLGPVTAIASSYGEPFAYRPEDRAVMAVDGDLATAWRVGDHGDPVGERLRLVLDEGTSPTGSIRLVQASVPRGGRSIGSVTITVGATAVDVDLAPVSLTASGQTVAIPVVTPGDVVEIEIRSLVAGDAGTAAALAGVGFAEVDLGAGPTTELIRPPTDVLEAVTDDTPLSYVFTRLRTDASDPWRADPEPALRRTFTVPHDLDAQLEFELRLDRRASDADLAALLSPDRPTAIASGRLTGSVEQRGAAAVDGDPTTAWVTPFDLALGQELTLPDGIGVVSPLTLRQRNGSYSTITEITLGNAAGSLRLAVEPPGADGVSTISLPVDRLAADDGPLSITITGIDAARTIDRRYGSAKVLPAAIAEVGGLDGALEPPPPRDETIVVECRDGYVELDGVPIAVSFSTTVGELLDGTAVTARPCDDEAGRLPAGDHRLDATGDGAIQVDRAVFRSARAPTALAAAPTLDVEERTQRSRSATLRDCDDGCWIVLGEGYDEAWNATLDGVDLGEPVRVDGGFNGWFVPGATQPRTVEFQWTAQTPVTVGLAISGLTAAGCLAVVAMTRDRRRPEVDPRRRAWATRLGVDGPASPRRAAAGAIALAVSAALLVSPAWGVAAAGVGALAVLVAAVAPSASRRLPLLELAGATAFVVTAIGAVQTVRAERPFPDAGWTDAVDHLNGLAVFAFLALAVGASFPSDARPPGHTRTSSS